MLSHLFVCLPVQPVFWCDSWKSPVFHPPPACRCISQVCKVPLFLKWCTPSHWLRSTLALSLSPRTHELQLFLSPPLYYLLYKTTESSENLKVRMSWGGRFPHHHAACQTSWWLKGKSAALPASLVSNPGDCGGVTARCCCPQRLTPQQWLDVDVEIKGGDFLSSVRVNLSSLLYVCMTTSPPP